jgi:hypothetical protein
MSVGHGLMLGTAAALSTQFTLQAAARLLRVGYPWMQLSLPSLSTIALVVGCMDAFVMQCVMSALGYETFDNFWRDTLQGAFGRVVGTFAFLAVSLEVRGRLAHQLGVEEGL